MVLELIKLHISFVSGRYIQENCVHHFQHLLLYMEKSECLIFTEAIYKNKNVVCKLTEWLNSGMTGQPQKTFQLGQRGLRRPNIA